jgi:hypothetical protein
MRSVRVPSILGGLAIAPAIIAQSAGVKFVYVACMAASQHALLVLQGSPLRSLADIKGKKVAFARATSAQNIILRLLANAGLTYGFNFNDEEWDATGQNYETAAIRHSLELARAVFKVAVAEKPRGRFTIGSRTRLLRRHPVGDWREPFARLD